MHSSSQVRCGRVQHLLLGLIVGIALASLVAALITVQLIGRERQRALEAATEVQQQRELAEAAEQKLAAQLDHELQLQNQLAAATARAEQADRHTDSEKAGAEIAKLRMERAKMQKEINERNEQLRGLLEESPHSFDPDGLRRHLPRVPVVKQVGKVTSFADNLVVTDLGTDNGVELGHVLQVYRTEPEVQYLGTLMISRVETHRAAGEFKPANKNLVIKVGDSVDTKILR